MATELGKGIQVTTLREYEEHHLKKALALTAEGNRSGSANLAFLRRIGDGIHQVILLFPRNCSPNGDGSVTVRGEDQYGTELEAQFHLHKCGDDWCCRNNGNTNHATLRRIATATA